MDALLHELTALAKQPLGTVVYLGAGAASLEALLALPARRLVLVQGDPDEATELRHLVATAGKRVQVISEPVAAIAQTLRWHRYNLASLNGPLDQSGLVRYYPRLRQIGVMSLPARPIAELLDEACPKGTAQPAVLVIDLPGQEQALISALAPAQLQRFAALLVRGCTERHADGASGLADTLTSLQEACWRPDPPAAAPDPLWPLAVLRFDAQLHQQRDNERRLALLQTRLVELEAAAARDEEIKTRQKTQLKETSERLAAAERLNAQQAQTLARTEATVAEREQALTTAREALAAAQTRDRAQQAAQAQTEAQRAELAAALQAAREAQAASEARVTELSTQLSRKDGLLEQQRKSLEERTRLAADRGTRVVELEAALAAEQARGQSAQQALAALQATHQAATTQAAAEQKAQAQAAADQLAQAQTSARKASEQARLQFDTARADLQKAAADRDAQTKAAAEAAVQLKERQKRIQQLEAELADATQRLELMHQELAKAEGQFDLLRELLLQEPTL